MKGDPPFKRQVVLPNQRGSLPARILYFLNHLLYILTLDQSISPSGYPSLFFITPNFFHEKNFTYSILFIAVIAGLSGCASIINGSTQSVGICQQAQWRQTLPGWERNGRYAANTGSPQKSKKKGDTAGKKEYTVRIEMEGYAPYETKLTRKLNGWFFGNLVLAGDRDRDRRHFRRYV